MNNLIFFRYRCDQKFPTAICKCDDLIKANVENLKRKLWEIQYIIQHAPNSTYEEVNKNELRRLRKKIKNLLEDVHLEQHNDVSNNLPTLIRDTENVKREIDNLIARFPINPAIKDVDKMIKETENLLEKCKKEVQNVNGLGNTGHNDEILRLLDEAKHLLDKINSLLPLFTQIQNSYSGARKEVVELDNKIKQLKELYNRTNRRFLKNEYISRRIAYKTNKTKQSALKNKELLSNIRFPSINNGTQTQTGNCDLQVPEFQDDYERKMREQFNKTKVEQNRLNQIHRNFTRINQQADDAIKTNKNDVRNMKRVYNDYLNLVDGFIKNIEDIADIKTLSDANEADLKILQNELDNLIHKLELFLQQLEEIEKLTAVNKGFLKVGAKYYQNY